MWIGVSLSPPGEESGEGAKFLDFSAQKGAFWCILGLIKRTFDRHGVSIFWPASV